MSARDEILSRVRSATSDITTEPRLRAPLGHESRADGPLDVTTEPRLRAPLGHESRADGPLDVSQRGTKSVAGQETLELFAENVADYRATVIRVPQAEVGAAVVEALRAIDRHSVVVPTGLDPQWQQALGDALTVVPEARATSSRELDEVDAVVTGAAIGIATTGTIVLDHGPDQGRRELTLVPDTHVCVIRDDQVVHDVPEAVSRLRAASGKQPPLTWISGPSATSDIELQRVEGVHGPRTLIVVIAATTPVATSVPDGTASPVAIPPSS